MITNSQSQHFTIFGGAFVQEDHEAAYQVNEPACSQPSWSARPPLREISQSFQSNESRADRVARCGIGRGCSSRTIEELIALLGVNDEIAPAYANAFNARLGEVIARAARTFQKSAQ